MKTLAPFLALGAVACAEVELPTIQENPAATCVGTLMDNIREQFPDEIEEMVHKPEIHPLVEVSMQRDTLNVPDAIDTLIPGDVDSFGFSSYDSTTEGYVSAFLSNTDGRKYYYDTEAGTACSDNTFAYNFFQEGYPEDTLLINGQCTWTGLEADGNIGTCQGIIYKNCPYEEGKRSNYNCNVLSGFTDAPADVQAIDFSSQQD